MKVKEYVQTHLEAFMSKDMDRAVIALNTIAEGLIRECNIEIHSLVRRMGKKYTEKDSIQVKYRFNNKANAIADEIQRLVGVDIVKRDWFLKIAKLNKED